MTEEKITVLDMNNTQRKSYNKLIHGIYKHAFYGKLFKREFKRLEITRFADMPDVVYVYAIVGAENDTDTLAAIFCRETYNIAIGKKGGWRLLNTAKYKKDKKVYSKTHVTGNDIFYSPKI